MTPIGQMTINDARRAHHARSANIVRRTNVARRAIRGVLCYFQTIDPGD